MKKFHKKLAITALSVFIILSITGIVITFAATTPAPGATSTYSILSSTYSNTAPGVTIQGDIGFTTGPAVVPAGIHINYGSAAPYAVAGTDQSTILSLLASNPCTYTFAAGPVDLATDTGHGTIGVYAPGVYCTTATSAATIGVSGITLDGPGTYIFRIDGALDTVANSSVTLSGSSSCDVFWTPTGATTLGANSTFIGTVIDAAGITVGGNVAWNGRALAFGGTVTTVTGDVITAPTCGGTPLATLRVIKQVINTGGGVAIPSDFMLTVQNIGSGVFLSASGASSPGTPYSLTGGTYEINEGINGSYTKSFSGDCSSTGSITLLPSQDKTCTIINTYIPPILPTPSGGGGGGRILSMDSCPNGDTSYSYYDGICGTVNEVVINTGVINTGSVIVSNPIPVIVKANTGSVIPKTVPIIVYETVPVAPLLVIAPTSVIPHLPNTGISPYEAQSSGLPYVLLGVCMFIIIMATALRVR